MARRLSWSDVSGGLVATLVLVAVAFVVLKYSRVGALHGRTIPLYTITGEARGLLKGSEVWLLGQKVGKVTDIRFLPPASSGVDRRIFIAMDVLDEYRGMVHRDAQAQIQAGGSLIGAPVVYLYPGTTRTGAIAAGDTIGARPQLDLETATGQFGVASRDFPVIINNVKLLAAGLQTTQGTVGAFVNGPGMPAMHLASIHVGRLSDRLTSGRGTAALVLRGGLGSRASRVMARVDSVRALIGSRNTSLGRLRRDSTLMSEVADIRNELTLVGRELDEPRGTAGRVLKDSALVNAVGSARREMTLLLADLKKHPFRYNPF